MERKSFAWVWAGIGIIAVVLLMVSGLGRRPRLELTPPPSVTQPIIVEPIQPSPAAPVMPATPAAQPAPANPAPIAGSAPTPAVPIALPSDGTGRVRKIQEALQAAGFNPGPMDGKMGRLTQQAIREFQKAHGLSVDGKVGPKTWTQLEPYLRGPSTTASRNEST